MENIKMSQSHFIELTQNLLSKIDAFNTECWEPKVIDNTEENVCDTCNGFLYICQGGVPDVDCPSCNGTGQNTERVFNSEKFIDFMEHTVMFGNEPFFELLNCDIDNSVEGIKYPEQDNEPETNPF